jgi:hypothetical protein
MKNIYAAVVDSSVARLFLEKCEMFYDVGVSVS